MKIEFKAFKRKAKFTYVLPVTENDIQEYKENGSIKCKGFESFKISISDVDIRENGSPKIGDVIAVNPENFTDQWLIEQKYFERNHEAETSFYGIGSVVIESVG